MLLAYIEVAYVYCWIWSKNLYKNVVWAGCVWSRWTKWLSGFHDFAFFFTIDVNLIQEKLTWTTTPSRWCINTFPLSRMLLMIDRPILYPLIFVRNMYDSDIAKQCQRSSPMKLVIGQICEPSHDVISYFWCCLCDLPANMRHWPMLVQCWLAVYDVGPTFYHWFNVSCLLGCLFIFRTTQHIRVHISAADHRHYPSNKKYYAPPPPPRLKVTRRSR